MSASITSEIVKKLAHLARLIVSEENYSKLKDEVEASFKYINKIQSLNTEGVEETSQVTGLENRIREDEVEKKRILKQEDVLSNAKDSYNGYFKVKAIFDE